MSKSKVTLSPSAISDKWNRRMKGAIGDIQLGIDSVTESPAEKAIAKQDKMKANLNDAIDSGRWANGLKNVSLTDWKTKTKEKVASRLSGGVDGAMSKRKAFDSYLTNELNSVLPEIAAMPDMTLEDSVNRVRKLMTHMSSNRYKK